MNKNPKISVILPVYNCQEFVLEAVTSVLNQTFTDFELIIIDDCSTDNTLEILKKIEDSRIIIIQKPKNSGYTDSLNFGINTAKGEYIARMDGDDICFPERFAKQVAFLDNNPGVILCGTGIQIIDSEKILKHPTNHEEILVKLCFGTPFFHPTIMARKTVMLANKYDKNFEPAEDYDLWTRLAFVGKLANLEEVLLFYRIHDMQISNTKIGYQTLNGHKSQHKMFEKLKMITNVTPKLLFIAQKKQSNYSNKDFKDSIGFFNQLIDKNKELKIFEIKIFKSKIDSQKIIFYKNYFYSDKFNLIKILVYFDHISISEYLKIFEIKKRYTNIIKKMKLIIIGKFHK